MPGRFLRPRCHALLEYIAETEADSRGNPDKKHHPVTYPQAVANWQTARMGSTVLGQRLLRAVDGCGVGSAASSYEPGAAGQMMTSGPNVDKRRCRPTPDGSPAAERPVGGFDRSNPHEYRCSRARSDPGLDSCPPTAGRSAVPPEDRATGDEQDRAHRPDRNIPGWPAGWVRHTRPRGPVKQHPHHPYHPRRRSTTADDRGDCRPHAYDPAAGPQGPAGQDRQDEDAGSEGFPPAPGCLHARLHDDARRSRTLRCARSPGSV